MNFGSKIRERFLLDKSGFRGDGELKGRIAVVRREEGKELEPAIVDNTWEEFLNTGEREMGREIKRLFF